ncbi:MAG: AAA-like domain-containing protein [Calothrix sp. FI2-JRJ7]|jgi:hypothetical protein|nr:AAA-like domain-containing protein [Calothrix sp. FI2-JRJ7]
MNLDSLLELINSKLIAIQSHPLNSAERLVLRGIWHDWNYNQMATEGSYSPGYLSNVVAPPLWQRLSALIDRRLTKKNCRGLLLDYAASLNANKMPSEQLPTSLRENVSQDMLPCFPSGSVPLGSPFYIEDSALKNIICQEIIKAGALVTIKAPREMGKTSLLLRKFLFL